MVSIYISYFANFLLSATVYFKNMGYMNICLIRAMNKYNTHIFIHWSY